MVVLRLKKMGRAHHPFFRLAAMDKRAPRDGVVIEELGWYEPQGKDGKQMNLKMDRINHWLSVGAQPSAPSRCPQVSASPIHGGSLLGIERPLGRSTEHELVSAPGVSGALLAPGPS